MIDWIEWVDWIDWVDSFIFLVYDWDVWPITARTRLIARVTSFQPFMKCVVFEWDQACLRFSSIWPVLGFWFCQRYPSWGLVFWVGRSRREQSKQVVPHVEWSTSISTPQESNQHATTVDVMPWNVRRTKPLTTKEQQPSNRTNDINVRQIQLHSSSWQHEWQQQPRNCGSTSTRTSEDESDIHPHPFWKKVELSLPPHLCVEQDHEWICGTEGMQCQSIMSTESSKTKKNTSKVLWSMAVMSAADRKKR